MALNEILALLIVPWHLSLALLVVAALVWLLRGRRLAAALAVLAVAWSVFWSLPVASLWAGGHLEARHAPSNANTPGPAQAIVVLGGNTANNRPNWFEPYDVDEAVPRVDTAARLYRQGLAPLVYVSGAALDGGVSEARIMAQALAQQGVPPEAIVQEELSLNTYENARFTSELLRADGIRHILVVTSALHMPRAMAVFRQQGMVPVAAPSPPQIWLPPDGPSAWLPDARSFQASRSIIKEYVGLLVYWVRGWV